MFQPLGAQVATFPEDYPAVPDATDNFDDMRLAIVAIASDSNAPASDVTMQLPWNRWEAGALADMSAIGYFFARFLNGQMDANGLDHVPLGVIKVCKGGTAIEEWISAEEIDAAKTETPGLIVAASASGYYNGMIAPIQDYAVKGALWYQGEGNAGSVDRISQYPLLKQTLVESWREQWNNPELPFYFVQLAPYYEYSTVPSDQLWPKMRESQLACLAITNTAMACIIDGGLQGNIHPPFKDRAGERLARIALTGTYGVPFVCRGPTVQSIQTNGSEVIITFDHVAAGLETRAVDSQPDADEVAAGFPPVSVSSNQLAGFALCGSNQVFYWAAQAEIISSNQVRISNAADVPAPAAVRYAWQNYPRCNLFNSEGLPAEPFRTDAYEYGAASGADSAPHAAGISNRVLRAAQTVMEISLAGAFSDIEDGTNALSFSVSGVSDSNVVSSATVSNGVLFLTLSGNAGASSVTVTAQDSSANQASGAFTVTAESSAYKVWRHGYFTEAQLGSADDEAAVWGDRADPDGDGVPNLLEYALSQNPQGTNDLLNPVSIVLEDGVIKARFLRSKEAAGDSSVTVGLQTVSSLPGSDPWTTYDSGDVLHQDLGDAELRDAVLAPLQGGEQTMFVRLSISRTEE
jgi:sialate O-acetylesterase